MAPNTSIGAASAINSDGSDIEGTLGDKIENDAVALIRGTAELAAELGVSANHLSKVMQRLHRAGLLTSVRGPQGGFRLAKPLDRITLLALYEAIEGTLETTTCLFGKPVCGKCCCVLGPLLRETSEKFRNHLASTTLAASIKEG
jgi:Rrf2 family protein